MWSASFFSGLEYLLNRNDGEELVGRLSNVRFLTVLFFIVRSACNLLPEFTSLLEDAAMTDLTNAARYLALAGGKNLFILLGIVVVLVLGGFWLSGTLRFMKSARRRRAVFRRAAPALQRGGLRQSPARPAAAARSGFWAIIIGGAFFFDFTLDGTDVLPDVARPADHLRGRADPVAHRAAAPRLAARRPVCARLGRAGGLRGLFCPRRRPDERPPRPSPPPSSPR